MKAIERLYKYLEYKDIKPGTFEKQIRLSQGYLGKMYGRRADMGEGIILQIIENCPEINLLWLLTGEGQMLRDEQPTLASTPVVVYESDPRDIELIAAKDGIIATKDELIAMLRDRVSDLEKGSKSVGLGSARSAAAEAIPGTHLIK